MTKEDISANSDGCKYRNDVDLLKRATNPLVIIVDYVTDNTTVLDIGCACGDLGIALKKYKNSEMYGLEYNQKSVEIALTTGAYQKVHQFDLEKLSEEDFPEYKNKFDYIICADILEHLRNPMKVLEILKQYLKKEGQIIVSIPNVAHMSIKSNLLLNDFTYTSVGLLDATHIHLFTYKSIASELSSIGLAVDECLFTLQSLTAWQPANPYPYLPNVVKYFILLDWHSYVCQYIAKISASPLSEEELLKNNLAKLDINESNAPEYIREYRDAVLACFE